MKYLTWALIIVVNFYSIIWMFNNLSVWAALALTVVNLYSLVWVGQRQYKIYKTNQKYNFRKV